VDSPRPREDTCPLDVAVTIAAGSVWVQISGEVDMSNSARLRTALSAVDYGHAESVNLDLRRLSFCDTRGCQILLLFEREAWLSGRATKIHGAVPTVRKVLSLLAPDEGFDFA
jgi:anti-anti-sigma regulatory factor